MQQPPQPPQPQTPSQPWYPPSQSQPPLQSGPLGEQWQTPPQQPMQPGMYPPPQPQQPPKKKHTRRNVLVVAVVAIVLIVFIIIVTSGGSKGGNTPSSNSSSSSTQATSAPTSAVPTQAATSAPAQTTTWKTTHTFTGNGEQKTAIFTVGNDWKITYSCNGMIDGIASDGILAVTVYGSDNSIIDPAAIDATCKSGNALTKGETEEHQGGSIYLDINGTGDWTVTVQEPS